MPVLTLVPFRCALPTDFIPGSYAYCFADRPVRVKGELITPSTLYGTAGEDGRLDFTVPASSEADDGEEFSYTVAAFDPSGGRIWMHNVVMPDEDAEIYDLVPRTYDLDLPEFIDPGCPAAEVVYCGLEPVGFEIWDEPTQAQLDLYDAQLAAFDECIANGGVEGTGEET